MDGGGGEEGYDVNITNRPKGGESTTADDDNTNSRAKRGYCKRSSVARQSVVERSDTIVKEAKPTQLEVNIVDGGGGKICDEAEGGGAVDYNVDDDIDGGGNHSFQFCSNLQNFGVTSAVPSTK